MQHFGPVQALGKPNLSHLRPVSLGTFLFGACYYPEHWTDDVRRYDAEWMAEAGFNCVRMGEFAWDLLEPEEHRFDFSLFDATIARLGARGIKTILGTPTAAPPRWLTQMHPEILRQNAEGVAMQHGSRQHADVHHPLFRHHCRRITQVLAAHYRDNPDVIGWQTDNELYGHFAQDHSPAARHAFIAYLKEKYHHSIQQLNQAWGTAFWAQTYATFEQIETPREGRPTYANPSQMLDYARFLSESIARFQHEQVAILRSVNPNWLIFHNGVMQKIDYRGLFSQDLDALGFDVYPFFVREPRKRPARHAYALDRTRAMAGNFLVPEHQSGPGGQPPYFHNHPEPGEIRLYAWSSIAHGADGLLFFRWRTCAFGAEMYWCGILDQDNIRRRRYVEVKLLGEELRAAGPHILGTHVRIQVAIADADYDNQEAHWTYPLGLPSPGETAAVLHEWFWRRNYAVGCVHPEDSLENVKLYLIPHWVIFDPAWAVRLASWVESGGVLVIGARTASRDQRNHVILSPLPGCLASLAGITVEEYGKQNEGDRPPHRLRFIDSETEVGTADWYESFKMQSASALAVWTTRHLSGQTAISCRALGEGLVIAVGTYLHNSGLLDALLPRVCALARVEPLLPDLPEGVEVVNRTSEENKLLFLLNHQDHPVTLPEVPRGRCLIRQSDFAGGPMQLPARGVCLLKRIS